MRRLNLPIAAALSIPFPAVLFATALFTDVAYWLTADPLWSTMSSWLLLAGLVIATLAFIAEVLRLPGGLRRRSARIHLLGDGLAILLSILNFIFHVRDGYSAVVPAGPLLSAPVVLTLLFTRWTGSNPVRRHRVASGAAIPKEA
jgi:uncharacterized membrane protein